MYYSYVTGMYFQKKLNYQLKKADSINITIQSTFNIFILKHFKSIQNV